MAPGLELGNAAAPVPPANEETFLCLRGPCSYYWERREPFGDGAHEQRLRFCTYGPLPVELTDHNVYGCNRHDPPRLLRRLLGVL